MQVEFVTRVDLIVKQSKFYGHHHSSSSYFSPLLLLDVGT